MSTTDNVNEQKVNLRSNPGKYGFSIILKYM